MCCRKLRSRPNWILSFVYFRNVLLFWLINEHDDLPPFFLCIIQHFYFARLFFSSGPFKFTVEAFEAAYARNSQQTTGKRVSVEGKGRRKGAVWQDIALFARAHTVRKLAIM